MIRAIRSNRVEDIEYEEAFFIVRDRLHMSCTIVTGTYSKADMLREAAASVFAQTYQDWIWQIVLDGPDQLTVDVALRTGQLDDRVQLTCCETSEAQRRAVYRPAEITNKYFAEAETDYVVWLSDDDLLHPEFLAELCVDDASYCSIERVRWASGGWQYTNINRAISPWRPGCSDGGAMVCRADVFRRIPPLSIEWINASFVDQLLMGCVDAIAPLRAVDRILLTHRTDSRSTHGT